VFAMKHFSMQCAVALGLLITPCSAAARSIAVTPESSAWVSSQNCAEPSGDTEIGGGLQLLQAHAEAGLRPTDPQAVQSSCGYHAGSRTAKTRLRRNKSPGTTVGAKIGTVGARVRN
jgi:hypothetical protein